MNITHLTHLLQIAGVLHIGLVWAGATMPRAVNLHEHILPLPPFIRRLFLVYFTFIGLMLVGFGSLTFIFAGEIAAGEPVARALCLLMLVFWTIRLVAAAFVFDVRPYLKNWLYRVGYQATNAVFVYLIAVYAIAVWKGGAL
jgi:hypothetical protein